MIQPVVFMYGVLASIVGAGGALFLKRGAPKTRLPTIFNTDIVIGGCLYVIATVFFVLGLSKSPLSFFYPFTALLYLFAALLGFVVMKESVNKYKILGICCIILGIILNTIGR